MPPHAPLRVGYRLGCLIAALSLGFGSAQAADPADSATAATAAATSPAPADPAPAAAPPAVPAPAPPPATPAPPLVDPNAAISFEHDVRPIFKAYCFDCHGAEAEHKGELDLRLRRLVAKGGESGPAIVPGGAAASLLLEKLRAGEMPPSDKKVPAELIAKIEAWIAAGAPTLRDEPTNGPPEEITPEERSYWAFQPPVMPAIPSFVSTDRVRTLIDAVLVGRMKEKGLSFSPEADKRTLIRRATLDLLGLPPSEEEIASFLADTSPDAYEKLIDRLLDSPYYGERWGRHWLDVAGYADSRGSVSDPVRPYAYKYRDWVIRALNADKPLDRFIVEQLAGDELVPQPYKNLSPEAIDLLTATGFLRTSVDATGLVPDTAGAANQVVADTIKIASSALLGLTVGCAQCHDHRFDPISQRDYYALRAVFEPALNPAQWRMDGQRMVSLNSEEDQAKTAAIEAEAKKIDDERTARQTELMKAELDKVLVDVPEDRRDTVRQAFDTAVAQRSEEQKKLLIEFPRVGGLTTGSLYLYNMKGADELKEIAARAAQLRATKPAENALAVLSENPGENPPTKLFYRGDITQPRDAITPADLTIAAPPGAHFAIAEHDPALATTGRRLAWARHLTDGKHPLLGRVLVNRIWMGHFGRPLVDTPGDFGVLGSRPQIPELLDLLAIELVRDGWSLKRMHKWIMTSTVYRQSSAADPAKEAIDPTNTVYWHMPLRRLDAEALRDRMLATAGILNPAQFGPPVPVEADSTGQVVVQNETPRRSIYLQVLRTKPVSFLTTFDAPVMETNCDRRALSTVATQSLMMMNSEPVLKQAAALADRLARATPLNFPAPTSGGFSTGGGQWQFGAGRLNAASGKVERFVPLATWNGSAWQGAASPGDPALGYVSLNRQGGVPSDVEHATIRRWIAPADGKLSITGRLKQASKQGDGVVASLASSRSGKAGEWLARGGEAATTVGPIDVVKGDTIDFIVDCRETTEGDAFDWIADLRLAGHDGAELGHWNSAADFAGPTTPSVAAQVAYAWQLALQRPITVEESTLVMPFLTQRAGDLCRQLNPDPLKQAMADLAQQLFCANEFLYVD